MYEINYHPKVLSHDLAKLSRPDLLRIRDAIERKLETRPEIYGLALRGDLRSYWKLRIGDYRIVFKVSNKTIYILTIANRKDVYKLAANRL